MATPSAPCSATCSAICETIQSRVAAQRDVGPDDTASRLAHDFGRAVSANERQILRVPVYIGEHRAGDPGAFRHALCVAVSAEPSRLGNWACVAATSRLYPFTSPFSTTTVGIRVKRNRRSGASSIVAGSPLVPIHSAPPASDAAVTSSSRLPSDLRARPDRRSWVPAGPPSSSPIAAPPASTIAGSRETHGDSSRAPSQCRRACSEADPQFQSLDAYALGNGIGTDFWQAG